MTDDVVAGPDGRLADAMLRRRQREEHSDPRSIAFISQLGIQPSALCLEVGAGLGSLARWMAVGLAPEGLVRATEIRSELAQGICADAPRNLVGLRHDIVTEAVPGSDYDLIHARFVLEHLPARDQVLRSLAAALGPKGWLVIEDALIAGDVIEGAGAYRAAMAHFVQQRADLGSDYNWARNLPGQLQQLGLGSIRAQRVADIFESGSDLGVFWASVLHQESGRTDASHNGASQVSEAMVLLCAGTEWFSGPQVIQCAGRREPGR